MITVSAKDGKESVGLGRIALAEFYVPDEKTRFPPILIRQIRYIRIKIIPYKVFFSSLVQNKNNIGNRWRKKVKKH